MTEAIPQSEPPRLLKSVLDRLCCPSCRASLEHTHEHLLCTACGARFPVRRGIPLLAIRGTEETWEESVPAPDAGAIGSLPDLRPEGGRPPDSDAGAPSSAGYQTWYQDLEEARRYNEAYRRDMGKRWSTRRELSLLGRLLRAQPRSGVLLDLPSGGGRLSPALAPHADLLVEADIGFGQLLYGREEHGDQDDRIWLTASAFHIPFKDRSVDGVVCCRLSHHLPTAGERERLLAELLRVARRFVIVTYFDHHSVKNLLRRARRPFDGKPPKMTMTTARVAALAREHGAELQAFPPLSRLFSGHRYALLVRR
jgi:ubiquinone/menaquinone biosynthesis C-methylase UbiE/uncharacterized protein YbaR (Trm112 family)